MATKDFKMTKQQFYRSLIKTVFTTGQGLPYFVAEHQKLKRHSTTLLEEGKIRTLDQHYVHLPDDKWYCLTEGFCPEVNMIANKDTLGLAYVKYYRSALSPDDRPINYLKLVEDNKEKYNEWLSENLEDLEKIDDLYYDGIKLVELADDDIGYIKSIKSYEDNLTVRECIQKIYAKRTSEKYKRDLLKKLMKLSKKDRTEKNKNNFKVLNEKLVIYKHLSNFLNKSDRDLPIQEVI